jgi:protocatechuate 3,4-dioxygenase beta subunit
MFASDITGGQTGVAIKYQWTVVDATGADIMTGCTLHVWQANAGGVYSYEKTSENTLGTDISA